MNAFYYLIPVSLVLGTAGLGLFLWSMRSHQYEDLDGAAERILYGEDVPAPPAGAGHGVENAAGAGKPEAR